jgi:hypothetical protein
VRLRRVVCGEFLEDVPCSIGGGVVDDNQFSDLGLFEDFTDDVRNGGCLVVDGHDDGEAALGEICSHGQGIFNANDGY